MNNTAHSKYYYLINFYEHRHKCYHHNADALYDCSGVEEVT